MCIRDSAELVRLGEPQPDYVGLGALQMALFEETTEAKLIQPTFIIDYPTEISPLARASDANHDVTERFELFIAGRELGNGFSELNDPDDQAARFKAQADAKSHGDDCLLYTSDAADEEDSVDLGGRRIIKKKKKEQIKKKKK